MEPVHQGSFRSQMDKCRSGMTSSQDSQIPSCAQARRVADHFISHAANLELAAPRIAISAASRPFRVRQTQEFKSRVPSKDTHGASGSHQQVAIRVEPFRVGTDRNRGKEVPSQMNRTPLFDGVMHPLTSVPAQKGTGRLQAEHRMSL